MGEAPVSLPQSQVVAFKISIEVELICPARLSTGIASRTLEFVFQLEGATTSRDG